MDLLSTLAPSPGSLSSLLRDATAEPSVKKSACTHAVLRAAASGDSVLLDFLLSSSSNNNNNQVKEYVDLDAVDVDGSPALVLAACFGYGDAARILVEAGAPPDAQDRAGWTALHWAAQNGDVPLASYLLNHKAPLHIRSFKGLQPTDLARRNDAGESLRDIFEAAASARQEQEQQQHLHPHQNLASPQPSVHSVLSEASTSSAGSTSRHARRAREKKAHKKSMLAQESARHLSVDVDLLGIPGSSSSSSSKQNDRRDVNPLYSPSLAVASDHHPEFDWQHCQPSQMLVFGMDDLPLIFDSVISSVKPLRSLIHRVLPANVLFLCTRYAVQFGDADMLDELLLGAIEAIEDVVHANAEDLACCSFWLNNALLLLYYLRVDNTISDKTKEYQHHCAELVNELYVFVIRDIERRIDKILDAAILDYESLPGFSDLRFEGDWNFVKAFTSGSTRNRPSSVQSTVAAGGAGAGAAGSGAHNSPTPRNSIMSLFNAAAETASNQASPKASPGRRPYSTPEPPGADAASAHTSSNRDQLSPKDINSILSSALCILQLYEIAPCIIVQAYSQIFYWLSSELANRILTRRKYLCRSKGLQVRLNISSLEDWARIHTFPPKLIQSHMRPVNQLLQWLQCLSSEDTLDGLVGTMMGFRELNPLQLRKAVKDYRYEVDEPKMSDECQQYLAQLEQDWDKQRIPRSVQLAREEHQPDGVEDEDYGCYGDPTDSSSPSTGVGDTEDSDTPTPGEKRRIKLMTRHIDDVFSSPEKYQHFQPPPRLECLGELLDSRYMLPFALPAESAKLLAVGQPPAFGPMSMSLASPMLESEGSPNPEIEVTERLPFYDDDDRFVPVLPDGFLQQLDKLRLSQSRQPSYLTKGSSDLPSAGLSSRDPLGAGSSKLDLAQWDDWRDRLAEEMRALEMEDQENASETQA